MRKTWDRSTHHLVMLFSSSFAGFPPLAGESRGAKSFLAPRPCRPRNVHHHHSRNDGFQAASDTWAPNCSSKPECTTIQWASTP